MEGCCAADSPAAPSVPREALICPENGKKGKRVRPLTVRSLLVEGRRGEVREQGRYGYCPAPGCEVVYFGDSGWRARKEDLRVRVGSKETEPPIPVCYCFGYSRDDIRREVRQSGESTIAANIRAEVKAGRCACETKNPSGACCLGDVVRVLKQAQEELGRSKESLR